MKAAWIFVAPIMAITFGGALLPRDGPEPTATWGGFRMEYVRADGPSADFTILSTGESTSAVNQFGREATCAWIQVKEPAGRFSRYCLDAAAGTPVLFQATLFEYQDFRNGRIHYPLAAIPTGFTELLALLRPEPLLQEYDSSYGGAALHVARLELPGGELDYRYSIQGDHVLVPSKGLQSTEAFDTTWYVHLTRDLNGPPTEIGFVHNGQKMRAWALGGYSGSIPAFTLVPTKEAQVDFCPDCQWIARENLLQVVGPLGQEIDGIVEAQPDWQQFGWREGQAAIGFLDVRNPPVGHPTVVVEILNPTRSQVLQATVTFDDPTEPSIALKTSAWENQTPLEIWPRRLVHPQTGIERVRHVDDAFVPTRIQLDGTRSSEFSRTPTSLYVTDKKSMAGLDPSFIIWRYEFEGPAGTMIEAHLSAINGQWVERPLAL